MTFSRISNRPDSTQLVNPFGLNQAILMGLASEMPGIRSSMHRMKHALQEPYGIFAEYDFLLLDNLNKNGNRTLLVNRLNSLAEASQVQEFENLFLCFAGHAVCAPDFQLLLPERSIKSLDQLEQRDWLGWNTFREWLTPIRSKNVMIVLDTCYANTLHNAETLRWLQEFDELEPGQKILMAVGSSDEGTWASGENSFLSEAMVEAFEGWGARTDRGVVSANPLYSFLHRRIPELSQRKTGHRTKSFRLFWPERPNAPMALTQPRPRLEIDDALKDAVLERRCLVWAGEHLTERSTPSAFPSRLQWEGLERRVWLEYADFQREPGPSSLQLSSLGLSLLDTGVDSSLSQACTRVDMPRWVPTLDNATPESELPVLVRLSGAIGNPSYVYEWEDLNARFQIFHDWMVQTRRWDTLLIFGFPLDEPIPRQWLTQLTRLVPNLWMVFPHGDEHDRAQPLRDMGIKLILRSELEVLSQLEKLCRIEVDMVRTDQVRSPLPKKKVEGSSLRANQNPYRGLLPFRSQDEALFPGRMDEDGRSEELHSLRDSIHQYRKILLYGEAGVGKTSLLLADLIPSLESVDGFRVFYTDSTDPLGELALRIAKEPCMAEPPSRDNVLERIGFLSSVQAQPIVVCIDHLERAFEPERSTGMGGETDTLKRLEKGLLALEEAWPTGKWCVLLTFRKESYVALRSMVKLGDSPASQPFQHHEMGRFTEEMARLAITSPLPPNVSMEDALLQKLLMDLREAGPCEEAQYHPARLQLACWETYANASRQNSRQLSLLHYKPLPSSLQEWVKQFWSQEVEASLSKAEIQVARDILVLLVSPRGVWRLLAWPALRERLASRHSSKSIAGVFQRLCNANVVRERSVSGIKYVEFAHRYWLEFALELRVNVANLANEVYRLLQLHQERLLDLLPKKTTNLLRSTEGLWEEIPSEQVESLRELHDKSIQHYRKKRFLQVGTAALFLVLLLVAGIFLMPGSTDSLVKQKTNAFLRDASKQQSQLWVAIDFFRKPEVQKVARQHLTRRLLKSKGLEACKLLRALSHTTGGDVSGSVHATTGSEGIYLVHGLACPPETSFKRIVLREASLKKAKLLRVAMQESDLRGADLQEAVMTQSKLRRAKLMNANLQKSRLKGSDFSQANLSSAQLQHADLRGVLLEGTKMQGARLRAAWIPQTLVPQVFAAGGAIRGAVCLGRNAQSCFQWHRGDANVKQPANCPKTLRGPILSFASLKKEGSCPKPIQRKIDLSAAFCPGPKHPVCSDGHACLKHNQDACYRLAQRYETGQNVETNLYAAALFYRKACKAKHYRSCFSLGRFYLYGRGVKRNENMASSFFALVCKQGHAGGCTQLAWLLSKGWGVEQDNNKAKKLFEKACKKNLPAGCAGLGTFYEVGLVVSQDLARARSLYAKACLDGLGVGCFRGARLLWRDKSRRSAAIGLYRKSYKLLQQACNRDESTSCAYLGLLHEKGWGAPKQIKKAHQLYNKSCQLGGGFGCNSLGALYYKGRGTEKNLATARALFQKACERNSGEGCENLGSMYERAKGVRRSYRRARTFYNKSCLLHYGWGCNALGDLYNLGRGVRRSRYRARRWYRKACKLGVRSACP